MRGNFVHGNAPESGMPVTPFELALLWAILPQEMADVDWLGGEEGRCACWENAVRIGSIRQDMGQDGLREVCGGCIPLVSLIGACVRVHHLQKSVFIGHADHRCLCLNSATHPQAVQGVHTCQPSYVWDPSCVWCSPATFTSPK